MALAFRAVSAVAGADSGNVTVTVPTNSLNDIILFASIQHDNVASTVSGYTLVGSSAPVATLTMRLFAKRSGGAEGNPVLTHTAGSVTHCWAASFSGIDSGLTVTTPGAGSILRDLQFTTGATASGSATFTVTCTALTGVVSGDMRCAIPAFDGTDTSSIIGNNFTTVTGFTERFDSGRVGASAENESALDTLLASGAAAAVTSTANAGGFGLVKNWIGCQLAFSSDTSGGAAAPAIINRRVMQAVNRASTY